MMCDSKLHHHVISMKLNTVKRIAGLEIMTLIQKKIQHVYKLTEVMFKGSYTVNRNVLEDRQIGTTFRFVKPKYKD